MKDIVFFAVNNVGTGISGGDRIFIELIRGWQSKISITLFGSEEAIDITKSRGITDIHFIQIDTRNTNKNHLGTFNLMRHVIRRVLIGLKCLKEYWDEIKSTDYVYSASDFYPDMIPALCTKFLRKDVVWLAGFYLFAPAPFAKGNPYKGRLRTKGLLYWLLQYLAYFLIYRFADFVLVTSQPDVQKFITKKRPAEKIIVVRGGVDTSGAQGYLAESSMIPVKQRYYDACFIGRLHPQKGVVELIDIWRSVCRKRPQSRLVIIGGGELEETIKQKIRGLGMSENVTMVGFKDGREKEKILCDSKIVLHPAVYDSGGMAAAEAMAWGLPGVCFDLEALKTYYPKGMLKCEWKNYDQFVDKILRLLSDAHLYRQVSVDARVLIIHEWEWSMQSLKIYNQIFSGG